MYSGDIGDVPGVRVGQATDRLSRTGVTAIVCEAGAVPGVCVRGGSPGTRETDLMRPGNLVPRAHAVLLCGGSAYGLDAAAGAMALLERRGIGFPTAGAVVPIVGAAVLYDLTVGSARYRPDRDLGALAVLCAGEPLRQGREGAGAGATVGKLVPGCESAACGVGSASIRLPGGATVGAIVAVNALGDVYDAATGRRIAGGAIPGGAPAVAVDALFARGESQRRAGENTTIGAVATDALLSREQASRMAETAHNGLARAIRPAHTLYDGDTLFALSTGEAEANLIALCAAAEEAVARACANAAWAGAAIAGAAIAGAAFAGERA